MDFLSRNGLTEGPYMDFLSRNGLTEDPYMDFFSRNGLTEDPYMDFLPINIDRTIHIIYSRPILSNPDSIPI